MKSKLLSEVDQKHEIYFTEAEFLRIYRNYNGFSSAKDETPSTLLLCAKACFFKTKYAECLKVLEGVRPDLSTKILYERQALIIKAMYLLDPQNTKRLDTEA